MPIVSISLSDKLLGDIEKLKKKEGYSGRSEIIRSAIRSYVNEKMNEDLLESDETFNATITVIIPEHNKSSLHSIEHEFEDIIKTRIHQCVDRERCMNVLVVSGVGKEIKSLVRQLEGIPKVENPVLALV